MLVLRIQIGRLPIVIHLSHLLVSGLLAFSFAQQVSDPQEWPGSVLSSNADAQTSSTFFICVALWMSMITLSVLVHELGHALARRAFGFDSEVHLVWLGV